MNKDLIKKVQQDLEALYEKLDCAKDDYMIADVRKRISKNLKTLEDFFTSSPTEKEERKHWINIFNDKLSPVYSNDSFLMEEIEKILNENQFQEVREKEEGETKI